MVVVYRLKDNPKFIEQVQRATRTTKEFGIEPTDGTFGSEEWWNRISAGKLVVHTLRGEISKCFMGSMNDWPMFKIVTDTVEETSWTREANSAEQASLYREGCRAEIDYVWQRHRPKSWSKGAEFKQVLEIRVAVPEQRENPRT